LWEGGVIHPVDECHLYDTEVKNGTSSSNRSKIFSLLVNFNCLLFSFSKLLIDFLRFGFNLIKYINKLNVFKKRTFCVSKLIKQHIFIVLQCLGIECNFLLKLLQSIFKRFCSILISLPKSYYSRPPYVTVKSMIVVFAANSGENRGFASLDVIYSLNFSS